MTAIDSIEEEGESDDKKYCLCRRNESGNMIACDNNACPYEWFHWKCVGLKSKPRGKWLCPECSIPIPSRKKRM